MGATCTKLPLPLQPLLTPLQPFFHPVLSSIKATRKFHKERSQFVNVLCVPDVTTNTNMNTNTPIRGLCVMNPETDPSNVLSAKDLAAIDAAKDQLGL